MERRELPTHLHVEDKLIAGLTVRQVLFLSVGVSVGYSLWLHLAWLAHVPALAHLAALTALLRVALAAVPVLAMTICILVRPAGRPLEDWLPVVLRYAVLRKAAVWRSLYASREDEVAAAFSTLPTRRLRLDAVGEGEEWAEDWLDPRDDAGDEDEDEDGVDEPRSEVELVNSSLDMAHPPLSLGTGAARLNFPAGSDRNTAAEQQLGRVTGTQGSMRIAMGLTTGARRADDGGATVISSAARTAPSTASIDGVATAGRAGEGRPDARSDEDGGAR